MSMITRRGFLASTALLLPSQCGFGDDVDRPYLSGAFAPIRDEVVVSDLRVIGRLPADLNGMYVRNGPNPQFTPKRNYHLFEGDGMLHGVKIRDGKASYRNRWVRTEAWKEERKAGEALYPSILDPLDVKHVVGQILQGKVPFPNRANTALIWHHDKLLALWEGGPPHEISLPALKTQGVYNFNNQLSHACTAHPKIDPKTGELMFFGYSPFPPFLSYAVANSKGTITHKTTIDIPRPVMMHDMAITAKYSIFLDLPATFDFQGPVTGKPLFQWKPENGSRIGVIPRMGKGSQIKWFPIKTCFVFHVFNAFEEGDTIHLLGCRFDKYPDFIDLNKPAVNKRYSDFDASGAARPYRWSINLSDGKVTEKDLGGDSCEFPRVDDFLAGRKTQFGYASTGPGGDNSIVKFDFAKEQSNRHPFGKENMAGEAVFVPRQDASSEDDGYLVTYVVHLKSGKSEFVVLNANDIKQPPLARVQLPQRIPFGFHGLWIGDKA